MMELTGQGHARVDSAGEYRKYATDLRKIDYLENVCMQKDSVLTEERKRFQELKGDFKHNLKLLKDRDGELQRNDALIVELKIRINTLENKLKDSNVRVEETKTLLDQEIQTKTEMKSQYQQELTIKQTEIDTTRTLFKRLKQREWEFGDYKTMAQNQVKELQEKLDKTEFELLGITNSSNLQQDSKFRELKQTLADKQRVIDEMKSTQQSNKVDREKSSHLTGHNMDMDNRHPETQNDRITSGDDKTQLQDKLKELDSELAAQNDELISQFEKTRRKEHKKHIQDFDNPSVPFLKSKVDNVCEPPGDCCESESNTRLLVKKLKEKQREMNDYKALMEAKLHDLQLKLEESGRESKLLRNEESSSVQVQSLQEHIRKLNHKIKKKVETIDQLENELKTVNEKQAVVKNDKSEIELVWQNRYEQLNKTWQTRYEDLERDWYSRYQDQIGAHIEDRFEMRVSSDQSEIDFTPGDNLQILETNLDQFKTDVYKSVDVESSNKFLNNNSHLDKFDDTNRHRLDRVQSTAVQKITVDNDKVDKLEAENQNLKHVISVMREHMELLGTDDNSVLDQSSEFF